MSLPKTDLEKNITATPAENKPWPKYRTKNLPKKCPISDDFGSIENQSSSFRNHSSDEKCYLYRSVRPQIQVLSCVRYGTITRRSASKTTRPQTSNLRFALAEVYPDACDGSASTSSLLGSLRGDFYAVVAPL